MNQKAINQIDVLLLIQKLWSRKFLIIFVALICGGLGFGYSRYFVKSTYVAKTRMYVVNQMSASSNSASKTISAQELQAGSYLANDYKEIILSKDVMKNVVENSQISLSVGELISRLTITIPEETRIISLSFRDEYPERAAILANAIREEAALKIKKVTQSVEITTIEVAETPKSPSSPNIPRNTILCMLFGVFMTIMIILIKEVFDDRVKRPEDIEDILGLTVLGVVSKI